MAAEWFVQKNGKQHGPMSSAQLKQLADTGRLDRSDEVRRSDQASFISAEKVKGLFPETVLQAVATEPLPSSPIAATLVADTGQHPVVPKPRNKALLWGAISVGCLFVLFVVSLFVAGANASNAKAAVAEADRLWDAGQKTEAISKYRILLDNTWLGDGEKPRVFGRVIDMDLQKGDRASATAVVAHAEKRKIVPLVNTKEAQHLVSEMQARLVAAAAERKKQEAQAKEKGIGDEQLTSQTSTSYKVKTGLFSSLMVELTPDVAEDIELSNFAWEGNKLVFNLKVRNITRMGGWRGEVTDKDKVQIADDRLWLASHSPASRTNIGLGKTAKAHIFTENKDQAVRIVIRND